MILCEQMHGTERMSEADWAGRIELNAADVTVIGR